MTNYDDFVGQLDAQIKAWQQQMADIQAKMQGGDDAKKSQYEAQLGAMQDTLAEAARMQTDLQRANQAAWTDLARGATHAFEDWQRAWQAALSRYK